MTLPATVPENNQEDVQSIEIDLDELEKRYILPIDRLRSFAAPQTLSRGPETRSVNNRINQDELNYAHIDREAQESRAHAFYRVLGLPVMADDRVFFYNPGFNPTQTKRIQEEHDSIARAVPQTIRLMHQLREQSARARLNIFRQGSTNASVFSIVMSVLRSFKVIDTSKTFADQDNQIISKPERKQKIVNGYVKFDGTEFDEIGGVEANGNIILPDSFFESVSHIIRPLTVDPTIERTVQSQDRLICAPFLRTEPDTKISRNVTLKRPGIEQILRLRLKENPQTEFLQQVIFTLDSSVSTNAISESDAIRVANALLADNKIAQSVTVSGLEVTRLNQLIKTIKALVDTLVANVFVIKRIEEIMDWTPLPGENGPAFAKDLKIANLVRRKGQLSQLERQIQELRVKEATAKRLSIIGNDETGDNNTFALTTFETNERNFEQELNSTISHRNNIVRQGANALRAIELITGEISGFGLIDILAIYTALWAIDLDTLLSLLDDNSFNRLYEFNPELRNENVRRRRESGNPEFSVFEAITRLEAQVVSILAFADKLLEQKKANPKAADGGSVAGV